MTAPTTTIAGERAAHRRRVQQRATWRNRMPHLPHRVTRWLRPILVTLLAVCTLAGLAISVFPTRTWIEQRQAQTDADTDLQQLQAEGDRLTERVTQLDTDPEIELIARSQYGLVQPGEEAYAVLPAPDPPLTLPSLWPFGTVLDQTVLDPDAVDGE